MSVVRLVSREVMSKQKILFQSHVSAWFFNYFSRWHSTSQQMAHLAPLRRYARQTLSWASDGEQRAGVLQQTSSVFDLFESRQQDLNKGPSRPEPRAPGGSRPVKARMIVESSAGDLSPSESFKPYKTNKMRQCSETETKPCLCTVITQRRCLLVYFIFPAVFNIF